MKDLGKGIICVAAVMVVSLIITVVRFRTPMPEGAIPLGDVVSYCIGDVTNDGISELLVISGDGETDTGERHGQLLLVCEASAENDLLHSLGYIPSEKVQHSIDLADIKPMKVQIGDINGDGTNEVAICVYKTAEFHPVMAKRPFFFDLVEGNLIPVWLGSRLSRPFDDYVLFDVNADGIDEIVSIEQLENGNRVVAVYEWKGFGFEVLRDLGELEGEARFDFDTPWAAGTTTEIGVILNNSERNRIAFSTGNNEG